MAYWSKNTNINRVFDVFDGLCIYMQIWGENTGIVCVNEGFFYFGKILVAMIYLRCSSFALSNFMFLDLK